MTRHADRKPAKDPKLYYFKLCYHDWTHGTRGMTLAARMFYLELCLWSWDRKKPLPPTPETIAADVGVTPRQWARYWPQVSSKFNRVKAGYWNPRVKRDLAEFSQKQQAQSEGGKKGAKRRWKKARVETPAPSVAAQQLAQDAITASTIGLVPINGNPHHKATNLVNGADMRRHGSHAWCAFETNGERRDGLCIPQFLHQEFIGKSKRPDMDVRAWYGVVLDRYKGAAVGEDALVFWRNEFAQWVGVATSAPANTAGARRSQQLRKSLAAFAAAHPTSRPI